MKDNKLFYYISPIVEIETIQIERGFAVSGDADGTGDNFPWGNKDTEGSGDDFPWGN